MDQSHLPAKIKLWWEDENGKKHYREGVLTEFEYSNCRDEKPSRLWAKERETGTYTMTTRFVIDGEEVILHGGYEISHERSDKEAG